jgi:transcriptional regulator
VYVPAHFRPDEADVRQLLERHGAADLITSTPAGLLATMLPFIYVPGDGGLETGSLRGHVARNNAQWREPAEGNALVIVRGPDAYVTPAWYETKREHGRVVPTWNYITAHVHGRLVIHDDAAWVEENVRRLTEKYEVGRADGWSVDDAPATFISGQLRAIVGVEVLIERVEGKFKLSQNRSQADVDGVIAGFDALGSSHIATAMRTANERRT